MTGLATYSSVRNQSYDDLVVRYAPLVKRIAYHLMNGCRRTFRRRTSSRPA